MTIRVRFVPVVSRVESLEALPTLSRNPSRSTDRDWETASAASSLASVAEYTGDSHVPRGGHGRPRRTSWSPWGGTAWLSGPSAASGTARAAQPCGWGCARHFGTLDFKFLIPGLGLSFSYQRNWCWKGNELLMTFP